MSLGWCSPSRTRQGRVTLARCGVALGWSWLFAHSRQHSLGSSNSKFGRVRKMSQWIGFWCKILVLHLAKMETCIILIARDRVNLDNCRYLEASSVTNLLFNAGLTCHGGKRSRTVSKTYCRNVEVPNGRALRHVNMCDIISETMEAEWVQRSQRHCTWTLCWCLKWRLGVCLFG